MVIGNEIEYQINQQKEADQEFGYRCKEARKAEAVYGRRSIR